MRQKQGQPLGLSDYAVMIGGPLAFLLTAVLGIMWILGPAPRPNPIDYVRSGEVHPGMAAEQVVGLIGQPKSKTVQSDGGVIWKYHHGTSQPFVEEDADLTFSPAGVLLNAVISKVNVPVQSPSEDEKRSMLLVIPAV